MPLRACPCCGLVQRVPVAPDGMAPFCTRCGTGLLRRSMVARSNARTAGIALAGLVLYPFAVGLPVLEISRFGQRSASSVLGGTTELLAAGEWFVGGVIFVCSIALPFAKLAALLAMTLAGQRMGHRHRAITYRVVEWTGRWGMLDVLLVALLVGILKLGDIVSVQTGPGAVAFTVLVILSLLASASFDPHAFWEAGTDTDEARDARAPATPGKEQP